MIDFELSSNFSTKHIISDLPLCRLLLNNNADYPWFILVPRIANIIEIIDLTIEQRKQMWLEVEEMTEAIKNVFNPDKINIATIGNITPQLHIHIVARFKTDKSWPQNVWHDDNNHSVYKNEQIEKIKKDIYLPLFI